MTKKRKYVFLLFVTSPGIKFKCICRSELVEILITDISVPIPGRKKQTLAGKPMMTTLDSVTSSEPMTSQVASSQSSSADGAPPHVLLAPEQVAATLGPIVEQCNDNSADGVGE